MKSDIMFFIEIILSFLPFIAFAFLNEKANTNKKIRNRQYIMPVFAVVYSGVLFGFMSKLSELFMPLFLKWSNTIDEWGVPVVGNIMRNLYSGWKPFVLLVALNTLSLLLYVIVKRIITLVFSRFEVGQNSFLGSVIEIFYSYDETDRRWYIKNHFGQACSFIKIIYYGSCAVSGIAMLISCGLALKHLIAAPFYPVFAVIIMGELAFFIDGCEKEVQDAEFKMQADKAKHIAMYPLLRKPLREMFGDKLSAEGTTVNEVAANGGSLEDVLFSLENEGGHIGKNYAAFIRKKAESGLKPDVDYVRCGYELATGKSLLLNTPFYDKLNPYIFYVMNRSLLTGGKVLVILGRHGTEEDLCEWCTEGMLGISNIPDRWKVSVLSDKKTNSDELPDIGIISRSGVHNLEIHKNNLEFLKKVSFVVLVEPSRLVTTAQIGLRLLIKCFGEDNKITFCSVDRNCDGLVDSLSHILMTNLTEVSATEFPEGISSYMCWTADGDYLQHRILPGISRYLGIGTELSTVALKNQVKSTVWYGGDAFPVIDAHWIAKQYYHDLLDYAKLPTNQETFDKCFRTSFNMCNEKVGDYSFITVEDDRNNLFETHRNFATISKQQGFVNVISSEYMLREYMSENTELFTADAKAIPYLTADYARTKRNAILSLCLLLCVDSVEEEFLARQMIMMNVDTKNPVSEVWKEICVIFSNDSKPSFDINGDQILCVKFKNGKEKCFKKDETILFKRAYSIEKGRFESVYSVEDSDFTRMILDDLQNARYIAEEESKDIYIGSELKGHIYQKYLPGQFFTLNGKYYEMISAAADDRILVRRASEHISGRLFYRQVRNYRINSLENSSEMGAIKTVNNIDVHYQFADFSVETPGYWKLEEYNNFEKGSLIEINGVPSREYHHKQILKLDFSKFGDAFTDSIRITLTNLLNESFVTLFAENTPFISAVTPGNFSAPMTYSLELKEGVEASDKCIFVIEDSQLDIGLLIAMERNIDRIFQIISDYLSWNEEEIEKSLAAQNASETKEAPAPFDVYKERDDGKKKGFFKRIIEKIKAVFKKKEKPVKEEPESEEPKVEEVSSEVPEETAEVTEEVASEEAVSEETTEETVPEETVPEETVPEETVPEETVPEETVLEDGISAPPEELITFEELPESSESEEEKEPLTYEVEETETEVSEDG